MDTFVRSIASFDVPAWAQDVIGDTGLESAYTDCLKQVLGVARGAPVSAHAVRSELGVLSLRELRDIAELKYLWRIQHLSEHRLENKLHKWLVGDTKKGAGSIVNWATHMSSMLEKYKLDPNAHIS